MITPLDILSLETWILTITVIVLVRFYIHRKWQVLKNLNIPHEQPSILGFGTLDELLKNPDSLITQDCGLIKKFGRLYGSYQGVQPRITIADPEVLKHIYIKESGVFRDRQGNLNKINGKEMNASLLNTSGSQWKRIRSALSPTFSSAKLKDMFHLFDEHSDMMIKNIHKSVKESDGKLDVKDLFGKLSMDIICSTAFGVNANSLTQEEEPEVVKVSKALFNSNIFGIIAFLFMIFPPLEFIAEKSNFSVFGNKTMNFYSRLINTVIKSKKAAGDKARADLILSMLKIEISEEEARKENVKGMTRTEIIGNAVIMLMAGYDTSASSMMFLAYCLAVDPEVQEKVYQEVEESIKKHDGLTYECVNGLKYLDMCFKESLRMYGPAPKNSRYTDVDVTIKGIYIPAGTHVDIPVHALHYDEEYWDEPNKFIPERFEDMSKIDPMVFQPFGAGPRNCIGMRFALVEVKMAIAKLVHNFQLKPMEDTPKPPLELKFRGTVQPKEIIYLKAIPRSILTD